MKNFYIVFLFCCSYFAAAQSFYEIAWGNETNYTALITYYSNEEVSVRVKYTTPADVFKVAKYKCKGRYEYQSNGHKYFIFDGDNAEMVYESQETEYGYVADNFIFTNLNEKNVFEELYIIDDQDYDEDEVSSHTYKATFEKIDPKTKFTERYLNSFYSKKETEYKKLLAFYAGEDIVSETQSNEVDLENITLHLMIAADTKDRSIGRSTQQDMDDIYTTFSKISAELGIKIKKYRVAGDNFSKSRIFNNINSISNGENDIVIFYYSGHGFNDESKESSFASMSLDGPEYSLEELYHRLKNKNARLTMIIGDLCNSIPETRRGTGIKESIPFKSGYFFDAEKLYKLFVESKGTLLSSSSSKGEWSYCMSNANRTLGNGHFTHSFIEAIIKETSKVYQNSTNWSKIFDRAFTDAAKNTSDKINQNGRRGQHGIKYVNINYN